ncbi:MAG: hypothetical protein Q4P24_17690 [Rhodobacterales bacterium]|nr:hypothetical protein [Rhodobacterales bacterium]
MELYLITPIFAVVLAISALGGMQRLLLLVAAFIPFGMLAVIGLPAIGGLSLLAVYVAAAALIAGGCLVLAGRLLRGASVTVVPATLALLLYAGYSIFSATVLVRLFAGEMMVFSLTRDDTGVRVSTMFSWGKIWLNPSSSNISQTFYIVLACSLFIAIAYVLSRRGADFGVRCLALAATVNLVLGVMDLAALDALLDIVRTANYSLANEASVHGIPRVIGGYSEAASFGSASAMFFAYFASAFTYSGRFKDGALAFGNGAFALLALSATGIIALAVVFSLLSLRVLLSPPQRISRMRLFLLAIGLAAVAIAVAATLTLTDAPDAIAAIIQDLIFDKSQSSSGLERTAWAMGGLEALRDTWGLGAGAGSLRSNGLPFVLLGSVGIPGTAAFVAFLWLAFGGRVADGESAGERAAILSNSRLAALAVLVSMLLAATVSDPGVPLMLLAALAVSARQPQPAVKDSEANPASRAVLAVDTSSVPGDPAF